MGSEWKTRLGLLSLGIAFALSPLKQFAQDTIKQGQEGRSLFFPTHFPHQGITSILLPRLSPRAPSGPRFASGLALSIQGQSFSSGMTARMWAKHSS